MMTGLSALEYNPASTGSRAERLFVRLHLEIVGPYLQRQGEVEGVLRSLPMWFGIEDAIRMYVADTGSLPTFAAEVQGVLVGFISLLRHFPESCEVHCMAVSSEHRNEGIGTILLLRAEHFVSQQGGWYLQVKTVAETSPSAAYAETRKFYQTKKFIPLEVFPTLWDARNPALQLVKVLGAA